MCVCVSCHAMGEPACDSALMLRMGGRAKGGRYHPPLEVPLEVLLRPPPSEGRAGSSGRKKTGSCVEMVPFVFSALLLFLVGGSPQDDASFCSGGFFPCLLVFGFINGAWNTQTTIGPLSCEEQPDKS